ncbi:MAG: hypothetical protein M3R61_15990 [Chloroflexota bacterium]|nr:hypothetical protein [Chloroflexota bacterium]
MEDPDDEIENLHVGFRYQSEASTVSTHVVSRYSSQAEARQGFEALLNHDNLLYGDLSPRQELAYRSNMAQNISVLCSNRPYSPKTLPPICIAMAQYGSYISVFSAPIDNRVMNYADYEVILREIDKRMGTVADQ